MAGKKSKNIVYLVHCIDSEGPLYESTQATFDRLEEIFGITLEPNIENLHLLQKKKLDLNGLENEVAKVVAPHLVNYNDTWDKIDDMVHHLLSEKFLNQKVDSFGNTWVFNWFCMDFVDFEYNPRRRDMGYHNIFDHYRGLLRRNNVPTDNIYFHFHAVPFNKYAHYCASNFLSFSNTLFKILSRRIIDRNWFPSTYRSGCQTIRPDIHWFLEQYIPFDFSSLAFGEMKGQTQVDCMDGRYDDWRKTKITWKPYHPSHDDYQQEGKCRRWITRCLNIQGRLSSITQEEMDRAFQEAKDGRPAIVSFSDHDFRDIRPDIEACMKMLDRSKEIHPEINYKFCNAVEAMRTALELTPKNPCKFNIEFKTSGRDGHKVHIESDSPTFGPQPFFTIKTKSGQYFHDNLDFEIPFESWSYVFDTMTFPLDAIEKIGIAANDDFGNTTVVVVDLIHKQTTNRFYNKMGSGRNNG